jgi:threonine dehydratase
MSTSDQLSVPTTLYERVTAERLAEARVRVSAHARHTPLLTSRVLSERTGFNVRLKAEVFQRTGSYKLRGPLNKLALLSTMSESVVSSAHQPATTPRAWRSRPPCTGFVPSS